MSDMPGLEPAVVTAIEDYLRSLLAHASAEQMLAAGLPRACGRLLRRPVLTVSCQPSLEAPRSERHLVFQRVSGNPWTTSRVAFITPLHLLGRRGIRPRFSDQDVGLILVASIEHSWLLRGAAKPDG